MEYLTEQPLSRRLKRPTDLSEGALQRRRTALRDRGFRIQHLLEEDGPVPLESLDGTIENFIGFARIPVGVVGPVRIRGIAAEGDFYVPMATTEGTLVACYQRGARAMSLSGGATVACTAEAVQRTPYFEFASLTESHAFARYVEERAPDMQKIVSRTSRHCRLQDIRTQVLGREVFLVCDYKTGDASGQNMVTFATDAICRALIGDSPAKPRRFFVEGNLSGDKKATMTAFQSVRGKRVTAEANLSPSIIRRHLHVEVPDLLRCAEACALGGVMSGAMGIQGHFANALAAIFIACGQDAACVSEASVGIARMAPSEDGGVYASVTLPNLIVGTVGGGSHLPTMRECLDMMGCYGSGKARKLAEIICATVLAGEISIISAIAAGEFALAHARHGRSARAQT